MLPYRHLDNHDTVPGDVLPVKRDSAVEAQGDTKPAPLTHWKECARFGKFELRKRTEETPSEKTKTEEETKADEIKSDEKPPRQPILETISDFWWGPPSHVEDTTESTSTSRPPPPTIRRHTTDSTRLTSRTAHIRTSADLPSQRARGSYPVTRAQIADRRPRVSSTQSSGAVPSRASYAPPSYHRTYFDHRAQYSPYTAQSNTPALDYHTSLDARTHSSPYTSQTNTPPLHYRTSSDSWAHSSPSTVPTYTPARHHRPSSYPRTHSSPTTHPTHRRIPPHPPYPHRPSSHLSRSHTDFIPSFSYPIHTLPAETWKHYPHSLQWIIPNTKGLTLPQTNLAKPIAPCPAPPPFRYRRSAAEHRKAAVRLASDGIDTEEVKVALEGETGEAGGEDGKEAGSSELTSGERWGFMGRARKVQETMVGLRRRLSACKKASVEEKSENGCVCGASRVKDPDTQSRTESGSIDEAVDRAVWKALRFANAVHGDEDEDDGEKRRQGYEKFGGSIENEKTERLNEKTTRKDGGKSKACSRKEMNESGTDDTDEEIPDLPIPADVLAAGTSARLRRRHSLPISPRYITTSSPRSIERIPVAQATYTHANSSNTFASDRSTVLRRRMSCCAVEARIAALAWSTDTRYLQLQAKGDGQEGAETTVREWRARVARLEIEIDRMVAGGLVDQFEELVERLHILEDERKAFAGL
ncbi:hypothetical protein MBLNU457_1688t2 [Dothideomycetes sp. NU457]